MNLDNRLINTFALIHSLPYSFTLSLTHSLSPLLIHSLPYSDYLTVLFTHLLNSLTCISLWFDSCGSNRKGGDLATIMFMLKNGVDVNNKSNNGSTGIY